MAYGEFFVERQGWAHWPKVLIMCRKRGRTEGRWELERRRYVPDRGTCHNTYPYAGKFRCSACDAEWRTENDDLTEPELWIDGVGDMPRYCQNCGRRIVWEEDE